MRTDNNSTLLKAKAGHSKQAQRTPDSSSSQARNTHEKDLAFTSQAVEGFASKYIKVKKNPRICMTQKLTPK